MLAAGCTGRLTVGTGDSAHDRHTQPARTHRATKVGVRSVVGADVFAHAAVLFIPVPEVRAAGVWCVVRGAWCVVRGVWCVVREVWRVGRVVSTKAQDLAR